MKNRIVAALIVVIVLLAIGLMSLLTYKVATLETSNSILAFKFDRALELISKYEPPKDGTNGVNGINGNTPACYYELTQCRGKNGEDSVSTKTTETIIKEQFTSAYKDLQLNPETGDLETKLSTDTLWEVLIPCEKLLVGCPEQSPPLFEQLPELGEL